MVWFSKEFLNLPVDMSTSYGDAIELHLLDGHKIELIMHNCPNREEDHDCLKDHGDGYLARRLSINELKQLKKACEEVIEEYNK